LWVGCRCRAHCNFTTLWLFSSPQQHLYLSTNSGVAYSSRPHDCLVRFHTQQHYPIIPSSTNLYTPSWTLVLNRVPEREQAQALPHPVNTLCRIGLDQPSPPPSSLSTAPNRPFCIQPPEHVDDLRQFNGYVFNVVPYPSGHFELLLFQMLMRAEELNLRHHRGGEVGAP